ncbi:CLUMA_CG002232, isoform A [Clunio marinus]|uniref:CLUMA_CG002232, isoform A n=1 Tax=Clunio marinus TaxID=568069 RepID=A0A1J1HK70_9DIPT|nr:CLUMA_CG002232, isoform A [Clunio marinus]
MMMIINDFPDPNLSYILAVQPDSLTAISVVEIFAKAMNQEEIRINICAKKEEVFLMNSDLISQRVCNHLTLNLKLHSDYLESKDFKFSMTGLNLALKSEILAEQFYESQS